MLQYGIHPNVVPERTGDCSYAQHISHDLLSIQERAVQNLDQLFSARKGELNREIEAAAARAGAMRRRAFSA
jgi:hypothetical protein